MQIAKTTCYIAVYSYVHCTANIIHIIICTTKSFIRYLCYIHLLRYIIIYNCLLLVDLSDQLIIINYRVDDCLLCLDYRNKLFDSCYTAITITHIPSRLDEKYKTNIYGLSYYIILLII